MDLNAEFADRTKELFGVERYTRFEAALDAGSVVSVRFNSAKSIPLFGEEPVPWAGKAFYLENRPVFTADPLFHAGCYYVQEASSMFLEQVVRQYVPDAVRALDLCAAPGGKTTHLLSVLPQGSLLVSNEIMPQRAQILTENVIKWGYPSVVVTKNEPADFARLRNFFDLILVDAPCSGEGMFRKDAYAVEQWSPSVVRQCSTRQREILSDVWDALRPGGLLIYSTCTFNREENENCVSWIAEELGAEVLPLNKESGWGITGNLAGGKEPVCRFIPGYTRGEGFFIAALRKNGCEGASQPRSMRTCPVPVKQRGIVETWVVQPEKFRFVMDGDTVVALPKEYVTEMTLLQSKLRVLHHALPMATLKKDKLLPLHSLAMSVALNPDAFHKEEVSKETALSYLHKETLNLPTAPKGVILLTYKSKPIGFVKNVGNRANNLYPAEWRIRKNPLEL